MTKERIEYWHEQLTVLRDELANEYRSTVRSKENAISIRWKSTFECITELRTYLRLLHGDWKITESFKRETERLHIAIKSHGRE